MTTIFNTFEFGRDKEEKLIDTFKEKFDNKLVKTKERYSLFDFISNDTYVELKSRRCLSTTYADTMVGKNKFEYADKLEGKKVFFCFSFTDGVYYWRYNKEQLHLIKIKRGGFCNQQGKWELKDYAFIPINLLTDINNYVNEF